MVHAESLRTFSLFTVIATCCLFIAGCPQIECTVDCPKPEDVECYDLSVLAVESTIICTDGNELQMCMARESDNCGYDVNAMYIPCRACDDCDEATDLAVAVCLESSLPVDSSFTDRVAEEPGVENTEALRDAMEYLKESY